MTELSAFSNFCLFGGRRHHAPAIDNNAAQGPLSVKSDGLAVGR
jgi:hypothetical protein